MLQTTGGVTTNNLWDEQSQYGDIVLETDGSGTLQASYTLGGPGASNATADLLAQTRNGTVSYVLPDGQGSVRALANSVGEVTDTSRYDAYGNVVSHTGSTTEPYGYDGQRLDSTSGLYQLRAREYDPTTGRSIGPDTAGIVPGLIGEMDLYGYAEASPVDFPDPSGHGILGYVLPDLTLPAIAGALLDLAVSVALDFIEVVLYEALPAEEAAAVFGWIVDAVTTLGYVYDLVRFFQWVQQLFQALTSGLGPGGPGGGGGPGTPPTPPPPAPGGGILPGGGGTANCGVSDAGNPNYNPLRQFDITTTDYGNFGGYPTGIVGYNNVPNAKPIARPCGHLVFLVGQQYTDARDDYEANGDRAGYLAAYGITSPVNGVTIQVHHIQPVKYAGAPTNWNNYVPLLPAMHQPFTNYFNALQRDLTRTRGINDPNIRFLYPGGYLY